MNMVKKLTLGEIFWKHEILLLAVDDIVIWSVSVFGDIGQYHRCILLVNVKICVLWSILNSFDMFLKKYFNVMKRKRIAHRRMFDSAAAILFECLWERRSMAQRGRSLNRKRGSMNCWHRQPRPFSPTMHWDTVLVMSLRQSSLFKSA